MLKRGRREHCSVGIDHQRGGPEREAEPGGGLCLWDASGKHAWKTLFPPATSAREL